MSLEHKYVGQIFYFQSKEDHKYNAELCKAQELLLLKTIQIFN